MSDNDNLQPFGPHCNPDCYEFGTKDGRCPGWTHKSPSVSEQTEFDFSGPLPPCRYLYRVKVRRNEQWFDVGAYASRGLAQRVADQWGDLGNAMVSSEPQAALSSLDG